MICPYCSHGMGDKEDLKFCPRCGHKLERCPGCGKILTKKMRFCPQDGTPIPEEIYENLPDAAPSRSVKKEHTPPIVPVVPVVSVEKDSPAPAEENIAAEEAPRKRVIPSIKKGEAKKDNPPVKKDNPLLKKENPLSKKDNPLLKKASSKKKATSTEETEEDQKKKTKTIKTVLIALLVLIMVGALGVGISVVLKDFFPSGGSGQQNEVMLDEEDEEDEAEESEEENSEAETKEAETTEAVTQEEATSEAETSLVALQKEDDAETRWKKLVDGAVELLQKEGVTLTDAGQTYLNSGASDVDQYKTSLDLVTSLKGAGMVSEPPTAEALQPIALTADEISSSASTGFIWPDISDKELTLTEYNNIVAANTETFPGNRSVAQMMLNDIYAKHGYTFSHADVQEYYDNKEWYQQVKKTTPLSNKDGDVVKRFNSIELKNKKFLEALR